MLSHVTNKFSTLYDDTCDKSLLVTDSDQSLLVTDTCDKPLLVADICDK